LKEAEAQVRRADRLAALGQLTAGLAHELRNPMSTMKTSAQMLLRSVEKENIVANEMAGFISEEVDRTNSLITRFLDFARPRHLRLETAAVPFDAELMEHVISNLLSNAAQASPARGVVTVKTRLTEAETGPVVEISVIDRGSGIDPKNLESIFNPFFTTKSEGVGLGLAIVSKIVDEHGGQIAVESTLQEGSIFRVYLPVGQ
jgi:signal transduction histidine kinase